MPIAAQATHAATVNPTTHGFRRRRASDRAPRTGIDRTTRIDAIALSSAYSVFVEPRSSTSQAAKYSDATFMEKIVFEKSYSAQLSRSKSGARTTGRISPPARIRGGACSTCVIDDIEGSERTFSG